MKHSILLVFFFFCAATAAAQPPSAASDDLVHFGDVIDIDVVGEFEYDWRGTLTPEGFINGIQDVAEPIYALCRSESEIAADIAKSLSRLLREPNIVVKVVDRSNRPLASLDGAVKTPSRFRLERQVNLVEMLVLAGGMTSEASGEVTIYRPANLACRLPPATQTNQSETLNIKISEILTGKAEANPRIYGGDIIRVSRASPIYVIGAVNNPRPIYPPAEMTVTRAIAAAGGLAKGADGARISIFRRRGGDTKIIEADLEKIKRGELTDEILKPFDIIDVSAKGGEKRKYPPVSVENSTEASPTELPLRVID